MRTIFSILFVICFQYILAFEIEVTGEPTAIYYDGENLFLGKKDGLYSVDIAKKSFTLISNSGVVKDIKKCQNSVCALFETDSGNVIENIDKSLLLKIDSSVNEFYFTNSGIQLLGKYRGIMKLTDDKLEQISSSDPSWKNAPEGFLSNLFIAGGTSFDSDINFTFLYSFFGMELFMIVGDSYQLVSSCNSLLCIPENNFIPVKDVLYPLYLLPLFFEENSKISIIPNSVAFYFSYQNILFRVDFSGFTLKSEADSPIIDFSINNEKKVFLLKDRIVIEDLLQEELIL